MLGRYTKWTFIREVIVILVAVAVLFPFYLLITVALKSSEEASSGSAIGLPASPTGSNFASVLGLDGTGGVVMSLVNSAIITVGSVAVLIFAGSLAAYTIARRSGRMSTFAYLLFVIGVILPFQLGMIPTYVALRSLGLLGTHLGMIILYSGLLLPLAVFIYTGFARAMTKEYEEAAAIDGSSKFQSFIRIVFPLLAPATGTVSILTGLFVWNDFFTALIFLSGSKATTLPVRIYGYVGEHVADWNLIFAAVLVSMVPILIFYVFAQKKFIQGFAGGTKG